MAEYNTKTCAICGKEIVITAGWAYKVKPSKGATKYFCTYGCMRKFEKAHQEPEKKLPEMEASAPKDPMDRGKAAEILVEEVKAGRNPLDWLRSNGYKNPYEAYSAVRH